MEMPELTVEEMPTEALIPYANNAKEHSQLQVEQIANSIEAFGFNDPVGVWENAQGEMEIVEGHGRVMAAKRLGIDVLPVIRLDHLTDEQRRAYTHVHNQTTLNSGFDLEVLDVELEVLDFDWDDFGFDDIGLNLSGDVLEVRDEGVPDEIERRCKPGEIWMLDAHRVKCGSATDPKDVNELLGGGLANLLLTDPPYGVSYVGKTKDSLKIENDSKNDEEFTGFLSDAFRNAKENMSDGAAFYIFYSSSRALSFESALKEAGLQTRETLIWVKNSLVIGRQDYQWRHEPCLYGWKDGAAHNWYADRSQTTVLEFDRPTANREHPTMKPIPLIAYLIQNSSRQGDIVFDPFGGSGTTLLACEQTGRTCYTMELCPHYCDVIIQRWENMTGRKAKRQEVYQR